MTCSTAREMLHDWFDMSGGGAIPPEAALHIRECTLCRSFVREWDRIELGLQSLRETTPAPSADFRISLERRPIRRERRGAYRTPRIYLRWAAATGATLAAILGITYAVSGRNPLSKDNAASLAIVRPQTQNYVPRSGTFNPDLPLAHTR